MKRALYLHGNLVSFTNKNKNQLRFVDYNSKINTSKYMENYKKLSNIENLKFDFVTCFHAIHYSNTDDTTFRKVLTDISEVLAPGGRLLLIYMDKDAVLAEMDGSDELYSNGHYRIRHNENKNGWLVHLHGIGREHAEPYLSRTDIINATADTDLIEVIHDTTSKMHLSDDGLEPTTELRIKTLYNKIQDSEKKLLRCYSYILFKKPI